MATALCLGTRLGVAMCLETIESTVANDACYINACQHVLIDTAYAANVLRYTR